MKRILLIALVLSSSLVFAQPGGPIDDPDYTQRRSSHNHIEFTTFLIIGAIPCAYVLYKLREEKRNEPSTVAMGFLMGSAIIYFALWFILGFFGYDVF